MRLAALDTWGKWEPCVARLTADQVADLPFLCWLGVQLPAHLFTRAHCIHEINYLYYNIIKLAQQHAFKKMSPLILFSFECRRNEGGGRFLGWLRAWFRTCLHFKTLTPAAADVKITVGLAMKKNDWMDLKKQNIRKKEKWHSPKEPDITQDAISGKGNYFYPWRLKGQKGGEQNQNNWTEIDEGRQNGFKVKQKMYIFN